MVVSVTWRARCEPRDHLHLPSALLARSRAMLVWPPMLEWDDGNDPLKTKCVSWCRKCAYLIGPMTIWFWILVLGLIFGSIGRGARFKYMADGRVKPFWGSHVVKFGLLMFLKFPRIVRFVSWLLKIFFSWNGLHPKLIFDLEWPFTS